MRAAAAMRSVVKVATAAWGEAETVAPRHLLATPEAVVPRHRLATPGALVAQGVPADP